MSQPLLKTSQISGGVGMQNLADSVLGSSVANITFSSLSGSYKDAELLTSLRGDGAHTNENLQVIINSDTASHYGYQSINTTSSSAPGTGVVPSDTVIQFQWGSCGTSTASGIVGVCRAMFLDYASTTLNKGVTGSSGCADTTQANMAVSLTSASWRSTAAINTIKVQTNLSTNLVAGSRATIQGTV